jgi:hypothetical protein
MATTEAERIALVQKLCDETDTKVRELHKGTASATEFKLSALQGWFWNQWNRPTRLQDVGSYVVRGGARVGAFFISTIPVLGSLLTMAVDEFTALARRKANEGPAKAGDQEISGVFLVEQGMQAYVDAVRKAHQAEIDYDRQEVANCRGFTEKVARFYYWKYRLERLRHFHAMVESYSKRVANALATAEASVQRGEAHMKTNAPKMFEDVRWHGAFCKDFCMYPFGRLEISGPTDVLYRPGPLVAGPNAGKPVPMIPTGYKPPAPKGPPPLPPRPPRRG